MKPKLLVLSLSLLSLSASAFAVPGASFPDFLPLIDLRGPTRELLASKGATDIQFQELIADRTIPNGPSVLDVLRLVPDVDAFTFGSVTFKHSGWSFSCGNTSDSYRQELARNAETLRRHPNRQATPYRSDIYVSQPAGAGVELLSWPIAQGQPLAWGDRALNVWIQGCVSQEVNNIVTDMERQWLEHYYRPRNPGQPAASGVNAEAYMDSIARSYHVERNAIRYNSSVEGPFNNGKMDVSRHTQNFQLMLKGGLVTVGCRFVTTLPTVEAERDHFRRYGSHTVPYIERNCGQSTGLSKITEYNPDGSQKP